MTTIPRKGALNQPTPNAMHFAEKTFSEPEDVLAGVNAAFAAAKRRLELTNAKIIGEEILAVFPNASTVSLIAAASDDVAIGGYFPDAVYDDRRRELGVFNGGVLIATSTGVEHTFEFDIETAFRELPDEAPLVHYHGSAWVTDPEYTWMDELESRMYLRKAAAVQLRGTIVIEIEDGEPVYADVIDEA